MKTLNEIQTTLTKIREHKTTAQQVAEKLNAELAKIDSAGRTHEWVADKQREIRAKFTPAISDTLLAVTKLHDEIKPSQKFWESSKFVISTRPVSTPSSDNMYNPADQTAEAQARLSKMQEYSKMPSDLLHLHADAAKATEQYGVLHLINLENNSRDTTGAGWEPIDLAGLVLPDQEQALKLIQESNGTQLTIENIWKAATGGHVSAADRITAARLGGVM